MLQETRPLHGADLIEDWRRKQDALLEIAGRCEAVNYPPDLIVEVLAIARSALDQAAVAR